jgi:poly(glycerol-phosphate) alpha-glucosyltransferase
VDLPETPATGQPAWCPLLPGNAKVLLYLGRLHPKKGLINLLQGWQQFGLRADLGHGNWHLVIAGWDQLDHEGELRRLVDTLGIRASVHFPGALFGVEKARSFSIATAFVLPSVSEGLPMVVLEAWSHALPVLMTRHCNLPEGFAAGAAFQIETDKDGIRHGLELLAQMSDEQRQAMGDNGLRLCRERFSLDQSSESIRSVYHWLLHRGPRPDCVIDHWKSPMVLGPAGFPQSAARTPDLAAR